MQRHGGSRSGICHTNTCANYHITCANYHIRKSERMKNQLVNEHTCFRVAKFPACDAQAIDLTFNAPWGAQNLVPDT